MCPSGNVISLLARRRLRDLRGQGKRRRRRGMLEEKIVVRTSVRVAVGDVS